MAFELVRDEQLNTEYEGEATRFVYSFTVNVPDQLMADWIANRCVDDHVNQLAEQGTQLLRLRVWEDKLSGTFTTDFKVEVTAAGYGDVSLPAGSIAGYWFIPVVIIGVLAIIGVLVVNQSLDSIERIIKTAGPIGTSLMAVAVLGVAVVAIIIFVRRT